jgi:hypothetical protein
MELANGRTARVKASRCLAAELILCVWVEVLGATLYQDATHERRRAGHDRRNQFTFLEQGADVVATGSGSINLARFTKPPSTIDLHDSGVQARTALTGTAGTVTAYTGIAGPSSFGSGGRTIAFLGGGDAVDVNGADRVLGVPVAYVSGNALSNRMEFVGDFASIGLTPGTYTWTWGAGNNADSLTVQIGPVPEPASVLVVGIGLFGLAAARLLRQQTVERAVAGRTLRLVYHPAPYLAEHRVDAALGEFRAFY